MRIPINLSSTPFRRDRTMLLASGLVCVLLVGLLVALISLARMDRGARASSQLQIDQLQKELRQVTAEQAKADLVIRKPENAEVLDSTIFLNSLLYRKGISWTRMLADLEKTLPYNVRVMSVRPSVNAKNQISLDLIVAAESPEPVIQWMQTLEGSTLFSAPYQHTSMPPTQNEASYRYRLSVTYAQRL